MDWYSILKKKTLRVIYRIEFRRLFRLASLAGFLYRLRQVGEKGVGRLYWRGNWGLENSISFKIDEFEKDCQLVFKCFFVVFFVIVFRGLPSTLYIERESHLRKQACFAVWLTSQASVEKSWTGNLAIPSWSTTCHQSARFPLGTELCIVLISERVLTEHSCRRCKAFNPTSRRA